MITKIWWNGMDLIGAAVGVFLLLVLGVMLLGAKWLDRIERKRNERKSKET